MADDKVPEKMDDRRIASRGAYEFLYWTTAVGMLEEDLTKLLADQGSFLPRAPAQGPK
jgi:hypothetical protein